MTRAPLAPLRAIPVLFALIFNIVLVAPAAPLASPASALTGSAFDATDGNLVPEGGEIDWCTPGIGVVTKTDLLTGQTDDSYAEGAKEDDTNPPVEFGSIPNNKVDLKRVYIAGETGAGGDVFVNVGWVRGDDNGTGTISFELNQSGILMSNGANNQRTAGDLLITFNFGGGAFEDLTVRTWSGSAWVNEVDLDATGLGEGSVNEGTISECLAGGTLGDGLFGEFSFNLTDLLGGDCRAFASLFAKSRASNAITSKLKELVTPVGVDLSTCGQLTILKQDENQQALGGATFSITPNPFTETGSLSVTDNQAPDDNSAAGTIHLTDVEPGTYVVCETAAPAGYILDATCVEHAIGANGAATFGPFTNGLGDISWTKVDDETSLNLCCATFTLQGIAGAAVGYGPITIVDNGTNDADSDAGELLVTGLKLGTYRITETVPPTGYGLPSPAFQDVTLTGQTGSPAGAFRDPPHPTLTVVKTPDGATATADDTIGFTVVTTNTGPGTALGVGLADTLPAVANGWQLGSESWSGDCHITGAAGSAQALTCDAENIPAGQSRSVAVTTMASDDDCGQLLNSATADGTNTEPAGDGGDITVLCPLIRVEKTPDEATDATANDVSAGDDATFVITVHNDGDGEARSVDLNDDLPDTTNGWTVVAAGTTLSNCAVSDDASLGEVLDCGPDMIPAGGSLKVTLSTETTPEDCGSLDNTASAAAGNDGSDADSGNVDVLCPNLTIEKTPDGQVIDAGTAISFTITVTNNGAGTAAGVTIDDELPAGFDWAEDPDLAQCAITNGDLHCAVGDLAPLGAFSVSVRAPTGFADCAEDAYLNRAVADATNHAQIDDTGDVLIECPDLDVTKTPDGQVINAGDEISFSITVTNQGAGTAVGVMLDDELPAGFEWAEDPDLPECSIAAGVLHCDIGDLGADDTFAVSVSSPTSADDCAGNAYVNTAVADASNHAQVDDTGDVRIDCPDVTVDKEQVDANGDPTAEPVDAGETAYFAFTVTNLGPGAAYDAVVTDTAPAGTVWTIVDDGGLDCVSAIDGDQQAITCSSDVLEDGASASILLSYVTTVADCGTLDNSVNVEAANEPLASRQNNADAATIVVECPGLNIVKIADADRIDAGETATFTITIWNAGPGDALDVVFDDELPAGLDWQWEIVSDHDPDSCSSSANHDGTLSISCTFAELAPSSMADGVVITVWAETDRSDCGVLVNTAFVDARNNPGDELSATDSLTVGCPTLVIDKAADAEVITISGPANAQVATPSVVSWTLTYTLADGPVTNAVITDEIPAGLTYVAGTASDGGQLVDGILTWTFPTLTESGSVTFETTVDVETISRTAPTVNVAVIVSDQTPEDQGRDDVRVTVEPPVLGGTPTPRPSVPDTAAGVGLGDQPVTVPIELLAVFFIGSLGALAFANVRAVRERRR